MTHLRQIMLEELERRNYAPGTIHCYIRVVEQFARHFHRPPDQLGLEHIRQYQAALLRQKKLAPSTVGQHLAALRFFYIQVLKRGWSAAETPYPRQVQHLPQVLSREEVARLIQAARTPFQRAVLMALYATGGRRAEVATLKVSDIDSQRMLVHIHGGKGRKDRDVMLSPRLLDALRAYWRSKRPRSLFVPEQQRPSWNRAAYLRQDDLERVQERGLPGRPRAQAYPSPYAAPLFRHASPRGRRRPAHHPDVAGSSRP